MPVLLQGPNATALQSHMPRTGGTHLRKVLQLSGVETQVFSTYSVHDGVQELPDKLKSGVPVVATFRPSRVDWRQSMKRHLREQDGPYSGHLHDLTTRKGPHTARNGEALGQWDPKEHYLASVRRHTGSWYEQWVRYFLDPADVVIPISSLPAENATVTVETLVNRGWAYK